MPRSTTEEERIAGPLTIVVMGVSGAGKSTVGRLLATRLGLPFADGDDFHPPSNVELMTAGQALSDADRTPWLHAIGRWISTQATVGGCVVACSALKRSYRDLLRRHCETVWFLHLAGSRQALAARTSERRNHFMPPSLLDSQLADLEPLDPDEPGATIDTTPGSPDLLVERIVRLLGSGTHPRSV